MGVNLKTRINFKTIQEISNNKHLIENISVKGNYKKKIYIYLKKNVIKCFNPIKDEFIFTLQNLVD